MSATPCRQRRHGVVHTLFLCKAQEKIMANPVDGSKNEADSFVKVDTRRAQYMIAPRAVGGFQPLSADLIAQQFMKSSDITFVKTLHPPRSLGVFAELGVLSGGSPG